MRWALLLLLALACAFGLLVLPAGAAPSDSGSVAIVVDESVAPADGSTAVPPAGVGSDEPIGTADAVTVSPPASVPGDESVTIGDDVSVLPPATISVDESVSPSDAPDVVPPVNVLAAETATVTDDVSVVPTTAPTTTSVTTTPDPAVLGSAVHLGATVASGGGAVDAGAVTFEDGTAPLGPPVPVDASGHASLTVSTLSLGSHTIAAVYGGSGSFLASSAMTTEGVYDYTLALAPAAQTVQRDDTATFTLTSSLTAGSTTIGLPSSIGLTMSPGATAGPLALPGSTTVSVPTGASTPAGAQTVTVTGDPGARTASASLYVNAPPVVSAGGPYSANEGSTLTLHGSATDTPGETLTYSWDLGGGATASGATPSIVVGDGPGSQTVTLTVCDDHGACASDGATITIANVAPTVRILSPADGSVFAAGTHVSLKGSFTDPGVLDTHTGTWKVGTTTLPATIAEHAGSGSASATWTPAAAGFYPLSLTIADKDGGTTTVGGGTLVVTDPNAGSVSGLGTLFDSHHDLVAFAFSARYRDHDRNADLDGTAELHVPHLNLFFTRLDWLVVTAPSFELQGTARVAGRHGYRFLLTGVTGRPDQLRVQIWSPGGALVYDSTLRPLRAGDIAIRR